MTRFAAVGLGLTLLVGTATLATADVKASEKDVSVTGEVIDTFCYTAMGAKGEGHKECGVDCARERYPGGAAREGIGEDPHPAPHEGQDRSPG